MKYILKIGLRYLTAQKSQTALLIFGVALGVFIYIFMSALIGGLATLLTARTIGNTAHVTIEAPDRLPRNLMGDDMGLVLMAHQSSSPGHNELRTASAFLPIIAELGGIKALSSQITGNGFLVQGDSTAPVGVTGVLPEEVNAIADLESRLIAGSTALTGNNVLIGARLASDLDLGIGRVVRLRAPSGLERVMQVGGIFEVGVDALDRRAAFVSLSAARTLFEQPQGISRIEVKLDDPNTAPEIAQTITAMTGLKATPWTEGNAQLLDGLRSQGSTGTIIKAFALVTIVIGIASALMLSTWRRRPEIGIMRTMGASRRFVVGVFVTQGALIGLIGGVLGAALAYVLLSPFPTVTEMIATGRSGLPVDIAQGGFGMAVTLTVVASIVAAIFPARAAARIDPVEAIGQ